MDKLSPTITSMYAVNKGLYLESFFSTKFDLDDPIVLPVEDLFFPVDLRFGFYGVRGSNDYFAFVTTSEAFNKHRRFLASKKVIFVGVDPIKDMLQSVYQKISQCNAQDVSIAFFELSKFYEWEFENYRNTGD